MSQENYDKGYIDGTVEATAKERRRIIDLLTSKGILFVGGDGNYLYAINDYDMGALEEL